VGFLTSSRKYRKAYPLHPSLSINKKDDSILMETLIRSELNAEFYWRRGNYKVDFILKDDRLLPIEVKYTEKIRKEDYRGLKAFLRTYNIDKGYVVDKDIEDKVIIDDKVIEVIPVIKFILFRSMSFS